MSEAVLRAVLVVALLAGAALGLQARQGLDWGELSDPVQVRWARVLAGSVVLLVLGSLARTLLRRSRRRQLRRPAGGGPNEPGGEPFPFLLRVLAVLLVLATLGAAWFVADALSGQPPADLTPRPPEEAGEEGPVRRPEASWWTVAEVAAVLLVAALVARLVAVRRDRAPSAHAEDTDAPAEPDLAALSAAVEAAGAQLTSDGDARAAIVAAYAAMAASISAGLARRGGRATASDTPTELLDRAVSAGLVDAGPAATLTALFREARFSRHPMGEAERRAAESALASFGDELAARRA